MPVVLVESQSGESCVIIFFAVNSATDFRCTENTLLKPEQLSRIAADLLEGKKAGVVDGFCWEIASRV